MKVTIELNPQQVAGIKAYLTELEGEKATAKDIKEYIAQIVHGTLEAPQESVSDYIRNASLSNS